MSSINIFCFVSQTGGGKSMYLKALFEDKKFLRDNDVKMIIYGTTRKMRPGELEGIDYYFHSEKEYKEIPEDKIIESRSYYTLNDGTVYYFTKDEYLDCKCKNLVCICSPYQYESYRTWCSKENIKTPNKYGIFLINLDTNIKTRVQRLLDRADNESMIYEFCRRVVEERSEFDNVSKRVPELLEPMMNNNVCFINNDSSSEEDIRHNISTIKEFIVKSQSITSN
jgi:guanylate kinase